MIDTEISVLQAEVEKIQAKLSAAQDAAPGVREAHMANFEALKEKRAAYMASWESDDAAYKASKEVERKAVMDSFDRGLEAFTAATGIEASWDAAPEAHVDEENPSDPEATPVVPVPVAPAVSPYVPPSEVTPVPHQAPEAETHTA